MKRRLPYASQRLLQRQYDNGEMAAGPLWQDFYDSEQRRIKREIRKEDMRALGYSVLAMLLVMIIF